MNRALLCKSFFPEFKVDGESACEDVQHMTKALESFQKKEIIQCGDAGTVLRFMALRVSRVPGVWRLQGSKRLFERPQEDLLFILSQLGVNATLLPTEIVIDGKGWRKPLTPLLIHRQNSSQFTTGVLLSGWDLPFSLDFELSPAGLHDSYWNMTVEFAKQVGMQVDSRGRDSFSIPARQKMSVSELRIEPDYSSMFSIAAVAALCGEVRIQNVASESIQPDYGFIKAMTQMKIPILLQGSELGVLKAPRIVPLDMIMRDTPDLFPVLAVLMAHAEGDSKLTGAPRLVLKESNRIKKTAELLNFMGVPNEIENNGLAIHGKGFGLKKSRFPFDPDKDHRMAMAAGVLIRSGWQIELKTPEVVIKSFPEFWKILGFSL